MRLLTATLLAASLLAAQEPAKPEPSQPAPSTENYEAVIIPVKTLTGDAFDRMVRMLDVFGARVRADAKLRTVVVYAAPKVTEQIQKVIADLDRPGSPAAIGRNIDMTISLIECAAEAKPNARQVPADLDGVVRQLRSTMQCANPTLWETVPMRLQEGQDAQHSSVIALSGMPQPNLTSFLNVQISADSVGTKGEARYLRFRRVSIDLRVPVVSGGGPNPQFQYMNVGINTSGDFFESQKTVVGKLTNPEGSGAIYAVIALKILD